MNTLLDVDVDANYRGAVMADDKRAEHRRPVPSLRDHLLRRQQLRDLPQPEPLIDDTLDQRTVALLAGRSSTGKSFLALDWACSIATGQPWQGRDVLDPGPVLYIAAEGAHGLHQRVTAWEHTWGGGRTVDGLDVLPLPVNLYTGSGFSELHTIVEETRYRLVVVDTWARSTVGGKENDNSDSTQAFERLDVLRRTGATVLAVAHTDAGDTKARGATALEDNADTVYRMRGNAGSLELARTKRKDGPADDKHHLRLRPTLDSCVLESANAALDTTGRTRDVLSELVSKFGDQGASKAEWRQVCADAGITSSGVFSRAVEALVKNGAVLASGTSARPHYKPAPAMPTRSLSAVSTRLDTTTDMSVHRGGLTPRTRTPIDTDAHKRPESHGGPRLGAGQRNRVEA